MKKRVAEISGRETVTLTVRPYDERLHLLHWRRFFGERADMTLSRFLALFVAAAVLQPAPASAADCDRSCLRGLVTQYLDSLVTHQPASLPLAAKFKYVEDLLETKPADGLWKDVTALRPYRVDILDARQGVAATFAIVQTHGSPALTAAIITVNDRRIAQIETMVTHNRTEGVIFDVYALEQKKTALASVVPVAQRTARDEAIRIGRLYPAGLKIGSFVTVDVPFAPDAYRFENGRLMAGPGCTFIRGCDQIKAQQLPTLSGITDRVLAVDDETGIVLLDQAFGPGSIRGSSAELRVWEAFKIYGGQIHAVEAFMKAMPSVGVKALAMAEQVAPGQAGYVVPKTPWGDPDLNGVWPDIDMVRVPVQRAPQYGTRLFMTSEEHAALQKREEEQIVRMANEGAGGATGAPGHWVEWGKSQLQTSLIVDPPDGRMPPLTPEGQQRTARAPRGTLGGAQLNGPEDFSYWERCISRGALGSTLPVLYNSGIDITQGPGYVALRYEMVHDMRIIPIDRRPHVGPAVALYMGDARGRWDGDTLVVETTNFTDKVGVGLSGGGTPNSKAMRLVERFTRVSKDQIRYEATVDDPRTWTAAWTVAFPLTRTPDYGMFEYACHEGNHGLLNALSGSRAEEGAR